MQLKSRIKEWIVRSDMTNEQVANDLKVSRETVSKWANNKTKPSLEMAFRLAEMFNCKVDDLYHKK